MSISGHFPLRKKTRFSAPKSLTCKTWTARAGRTQALALAPLPRQVAVDVAVHRQQRRIKLAAIIVHVAVDILKVIIGRVQLLAVAPLSASFVRSQRAIAQVHRRRAATMGAEPAIGDASAQAVDRSVRLSQRRHQIACARVHALYVGQRAAGVAQRSGRRLQTIVADVHRQRPILGHVLVICIGVDGERLERRQLSPVERALFGTVQRRRCCVAAANAPERGVQVAERRILVQVDRCDFVFLVVERVDEPAAVAVQRAGADGPELRRRRRHQPVARVREGGRAPIQHRRRQRYRLDVNVYVGLSLIECEMGARAKWTVI